VIDTGEASSKTAMSCESRLSLVRWLAAKLPRLFNSNF
jgi:hypothetical protein